MDHITKITAVETATVIWEDDSSLFDNHVLNGSLDVIAAIRTLAIKVCITFIPSSCISKISHQIQSSGQRIEAFDKLQIECGIPNPLKIALHSNVRWGTAYHMLSVSHKLRQVQCFNIALTLSQPTYPPVQPINLFVASADHRYGPITTIRRGGQVAKHIPWSAFTLTEQDWERVMEAAEILAVHSNCK